MFNDPNKWPTVSDNPFVYGLANMDFWKNWNVFNDQIWYEN